MIKNQKRKDYTGESPKSPNIFEINISNHFFGVMNDVIFRIDFPKSSLFNFYLIAFGGLLNFTHFGVLL
jgi:hypothetical protein